MMRTLVLTCLLAASAVTEIGNHTPLASAALLQAIPPDMQSSVTLASAPGLPGHSVRVRYNSDPLRMEVGPQADPAHIEAHLAVTRELSRYLGSTGALRQLISRTGTELRLHPGYGTQGFESRLEVIKLRAILTDLRNCLREPPLDSTAQEALREEIESVQSQLAYHEDLVDSYRPGRGFIAAYAPQDPAFSLDALLHDIWTQGVDKAYDLYMGKSEVPMDPAARQAFPQKMLGLAENSNLGGIVLQKDKNHFYPRDHLPGLEAFDGAFFVHFMRADFEGGAITERIYIDVHPDHAAEVMEFVVRELLKPESLDRSAPGKEPAVAIKRGIMEAKVAGPSGLQNRADSIVIYARSLADVEWGLARLSEYQTGHRGHFLPELPAATRPRLIGVSTAAEPAPSLKSASFGTYLANTAAAAMSRQPPPADFAEFRKRVREQMTADGVDPDHPDRLTRRP